VQGNQTVKKSPQSSVEPISDADLARILNLRNAKAFLKKRLEQIDSDLSLLEDELIARFESGATIDSHHMVSIKITERRCPSWKDAFMNLAGEQEAKRIIDSTAPHVSKSIVIKLK
jgi:hypothetical protein